MDYSSWFKIYRKRHPYTWRNKSRDDLQLLYESHKRHVDQDQQRLEAELKITEDKRKILSSKKGEKTFNSTCPHCFEHHTESIYYRKKEVTCANCGENFVATGGLKFRSKYNNKKNERVTQNNLEQSISSLALLGNILLLVLLTVAVIGVISGGAGLFIAFIAIFIKVCLLD